VAVGELKGPGTALDAGGSDEDGIDSPVEQAFNYSYTNGLGLRWVIVSNMEQIRLYHHGSINHYEEWTTEDFIEDDELTDTFWRFYYLMRRETLLGSPGEESPLESLFERDLSERLELTEDFYEFYREAVEDVYNELATEFSDRTDEIEGRIELIRASQKLMHRALVVCIFSNRQLLPPNLLEEVLESGRKLPVRQENKIYPLLKDLFWCINTGETENYPYDIFGYNGGLFAQDPILSEAELPDDLFTRDYEVGEDTINGVFGFHTYDFRDDLNEFVIGRIFEESITDFEQIHASILQGDEPFVEAEARDDYGVFFTREGLTEFIAGQVMDDILRERRENIREELGVASDSERIANDVDFLRAYLDEILNMRVADLSCGSGAFLVSCFSRLQQEAETVHEKLKRATETEQSTLEFEALVQREREIIEGCLHGNDLLQEAIEISKLSVWVRSARKEVSLGMLTGNFASKDALAGEVVFDDGEETTGFGDFDLVIGNPPWGGERSDTAEGWLADQFDGFDTENLDTYELFMLVGFRYLNEDGRLAFVLPQTILRPDHEAIREHLLENYTFERFHMMGADWFGSEIRMNTVTVQLKNDPPAGEDTFRSMTLVDEDRRDAITGNLSLKQLEAAYSFDIPQQRCINSKEIEPFRYADDDDLIRTMETNSIPMGAVCDSDRGIELNKSGHIIRCPSCAKWMPPPRSTKPDSEKICPHCGHEFIYRNKLADEHIVSDDPSQADVAYMDGDSYGERYDPLDLKGLDLGYDGITYKHESVYRGNKIFIRQAGVGLSVAYSDQLVYCPQSVYVYRIRTDREEMINWYSDEAEMWAEPETIPDDIDTGRYHKFLLGVLNSRVMHYYVFKRFGEIDAAQAFARLTQTRIRSLPIPVTDLETEGRQEMVTKIVQCVDEMLEGGELGGDLDWQIDRHLCELYGLSSENMAYLNSQMGLVAYHQVMQELYPDERPPRPERKKTIALPTEDEE
jgi:type I restriction-modification system DNA methylase subunit/predicted RNA-binding Zn-ribbon protein involved in translation (DUF1610 family)